MLRATLLIICMTLVTVEAHADGYIGTYTLRSGIPTSSVGIYHFEWDAPRGALRKLKAAVASVNPSYLALRGNVLYAVSEGPEARVSAYAVGRGGELTLRNEVSAQGKGPCHLAIDRAGKWLFVSNYGSGNVVVIPVAADGSLGEARHTIQHLDATHRPAHAHQSVLSPDEHFVLSVDLGLDKVFIDRFDGATGTLTPTEPAVFDAPSGSGPRHLVFSKNGTRVYLLTELSAELITLQWDASQGSLRQLATVSILPPGYSGEKSAAEIVLHPNGRWLYTSSRGTADDIAVFALNRDEIPQLIGHQPAGGMTPRFIGIAPDARWLLAASQGSDAITVFRITSAGLLEKRGRTMLPAPVDIVWR